MADNNLVSVGLSRSEYLSFERQLKNVYSKLGNTSNRVKRAIDKAVKDTTKATLRQMAKSVSEKVNIKQRDLIGNKGERSKYLFTAIRRGVTNVVGVIGLSKTKRLNLMYFGASQNNNGVTYKIERKGPRKFIKSAFITKANNADMVTKRKGKARLPIVGPLRGPSPWGVFVLSGMKVSTRQFARERLRKNMREQLRLATVRASGAIS